MHVQVKTPLKSAFFSDEVEDEIGSVIYPKRALEDLLAILAEDRGVNDPPHNIAAASGHDIELGGEFAFWCKPRDGMNETHDGATEAAMARLTNESYDARQYHVQAKHLEDTPGALLAFVQEVSGRGHHILEVTVGAPEPDGIPVQIFTAKAND